MQTEAPAAAPADAQSPPASAFKAPNSPAFDAPAPLGAYHRFLASPQDLPTISHPIVQTLCVALQCMYLAFYVGALANLAEIQDLLAPLAIATAIFYVTLVTAAVLIPVRTFLLCAVLFRAPRLRVRYLQLWLALLAADILWALSPLLLLHHISFGLALACVPFLVYSPFAQRALTLMGAGETPIRPPAAENQNLASHTPIVTPSTPSCFFSGAVTVQAP